MGVIPEAQVWDNFVLHSSFHKITEIGNNGNIVIAGFTVWKKIQQHNIAPWGEY